MTVTGPLAQSTVQAAAAESGAAFEKAFKRKVAAEQVKRIGAAVARHQGVVETVAVKQLFQRMSLTLMRGNAALVMTRKPDSDLAPAEVDGII